LIEEVYIPKDTNIGVIFDNLTNALDVCDIKFSKLFIFKRNKENEEKIENEENEEENEEKIELDKNLALNYYLQCAGPDFYIFLE